MSSAPVTGPPQVYPPNFSIPDPTKADLTQLTMQQVFCYYEYQPNDYSGNLGARISSIFVIGAVSSFVTFMPVLCARAPRLHIPEYVYYFCRYFGSGVIIATGFIHLLDPGYYEIGMTTCVGLTGGWALYSWPPAFAMAAGLITFLIDLAADRWVEKNYGITALSVVSKVGSEASANPQLTVSSKALASPSKLDENGAIAMEKSEVASLDQDQLDDLGFKQQITAFLILEFGVLFHSVIVGLTLGAAGSEFGTLYAVLVFHQSFEGLGVGARLSTIPFPKKYRSWPWLLCAAYGLVTPISIAIGLGVRTTFNPDGYTANIVQGVLDSLSGGVLIYTGYVELLARDLIFNPQRTKDDKKLIFAGLCICAGAGLMGLLGKWI